MLRQPAPTASERVARAVLTENNSQQAKRSVCRLTYCPPHVDTGGGVCHTICIQDTEVMRLIEQQMCSAVINKNDWRKDNTEVMYSPSRDVCCVYLHKNLIATIDDNTVEVYDGGWQSNTTKSRLNAIINGLCDGRMFGIFQRNFDWYIRDGVVTTEFEHGYTFSRV